jgi:hypothetical protein
MPEWLVLSPEYPWVAKFCKPDKETAAPTDEWATIAYGTSGKIVTSNKSTPIH